MYAAGCGFIPPCIIPSTVGALPSKKTLLNDATSLNAPSPIDVTVDGMEMEVRAVAPANVQLSMDVTPSGMLIAVSDVAEANAALRIDATVDGIDTEVRAVAPENAYSPMVVTPNGTENELPVFPAGN
jgi:hypothetical protein